MRDIIKSKQRKIFSTDTLTDKFKQSKLPEVHGAKKILHTNLLPKNQKVIPQIKKAIENKPTLGQGRAGIRHSKPQITENLTALTNKSYKIPKISCNSKCSLK